MSNAQKIASGVNLSVLMDIDMLLYIIETLRYSELIETWQSDNHVNYTTTRLTAQLHARWSSRDLPPDFDDSDLDDAVAIRPLSARPMAKDSMKKVSLRGMYSPPPAKILTKGQTDAVLAYLTPPDIQSETGRSSCSRCGRGCAPRKSRR